MVVIEQKFTARIKKRIYQVSLIITCFAKFENPVLPEVTWYIICPNYIFCFTVFHIQLFIYYSQELINGTSIAVTLENTYKTVKMHFCVCLFSFQIG